MAEQVIHSILLVVHNIALVGCAAAPFYNRQLVLKRAPFGPKLHHALDKVAEDTLQGNVTCCMVFITPLWATGIGMPLNYRSFTVNSRSCTSSGTLPCRSSSCRSSA